MTELAGVDGVFGQSPLEREKIVVRRARNKAAEVMVRSTELEKCYIMFVSGVLEIWEKRDNRQVQLCCESQKGR
jgi:hypothetical protein